MNKFFKALYLMRYYILSIFSLVLILIGIDIILLKQQVDWWLIIVLIVISVIAVVLLDALTAIIIHHLPGKLFEPTKKKYQVSKFEKWFYNVIQIRKWKDKIPEIGALTCDFGKDKIINPNDLNYIYTFLIEMGYAEEIHFISCLIGFLIVFILPLKYAIYIGIPIAVINSFYNILSALIQRFNRPKLLHLYIRRQRKED